MFITPNIVTASGATTIAYVQVPCACILLGARTVSGVALADTNTLAISDGSTDVLVASSTNGDVGAVVTHTLAAASVVKAIIFDTDKPIKLSIVTQTSDNGDLSIALELDEFVRKTD